MTGEIVVQLLLGVGSSVLTGLAVWLWQRARALNRIGGRRRFLGLAGAGGVWRLVISQHYTEPNAIHRRDVAAALELSGLARSAGASATVVTPAEAAAAADLPEVCVGGPSVNSRAAAHLHRYLPGMVFHEYRPGDPDSLQLSVGDRRFARSEAADHALLARICRPGRPHLFLVAGNSAVATHAAAAHLAGAASGLRRRFGDDRTFCLMLRVLIPATYGHREVEEAADLTGPAAIAP